MTECQTPEMQDLLPDYVARSLDDVTMARVAAHLAVCHVCTDDVALLRTVRSLKPRTPAVDAATVSRIVAALPKPVDASGVAAHPARPVLVRDGSEKVLPLPPSVRRPTRATPHVSWTESRLWRVAATVVVMLAGGASLMVARHGGSFDAGTVQQVAAAESLRASAADSQLGPQSTFVGGSSLAVDVEVPVSYGDLGDYTEEELQGMIDRIDSWDGKTSIDPLPGVPLVTPSGGGL